MIYLSDLSASTGFRKTAFLFYLTMDCKNCPLYNTLNLFSSIFFCFYSSLFCSYLFLSALKAGALLKGIVHTPKRYGRITNCIGFFSNYSVPARRIFFLRAGIVSVFNDLKNI